MKTLHADSNVSDLRNFEISQSKIPKFKTLDWGNNCPS
jgi:hypothetical protein